MTVLRFISGQAALLDYIRGIHADVDEQLDGRNINASGALKKSNRTDVVMGVGSSSATLYALGYWKTAGSGSPPGTVVSGMDLLQWAKDRGLASDDRRAARFALLVKAKILKEGSKQHREGGENVYARAVQNAQPKVPGVLTAFLSDYRLPIAEQFTQAFKSA